MGTLYLVATPIGNLEDISARALHILTEASLVAVEDTRHTSRLLNHFGIRTQVVSYHEHNKVLRIDRILAALGDGDVALVSDAGTPALNDPGYELVRAALKAGHAVSPIPGACAPVAALVVSGLPTDAFLYLGYLPRRKTERTQLLKNISTLKYTLIFLETPHRLLESLRDLQVILGNRQVAIARELTKLHEEVYRGRLAQAAEYFAAKPPRGEFTLIVAGNIEESQRWTIEQLMGVLIEEKARGGKPSQLARELARRSGWERSEIYRLLMEKERDANES